MKAIRNFWNKVVLMAFAVGCVSILYSSVTMAAEKPEDDMEVSMTYASESSEMVDISSARSGILATNSVYFEGKGDVYVRLHVSSANVGAKAYVQVSCSPGAIYHVSQMEGPSTFKDAWGVVESRKGYVQLGGMVLALKAGDYVFRFQWYDGANPVAGYAMAKIVG